MPDAATSLEPASDPQVLASIPPGWIAAADAAAMLGVTAQTVRNRIAAGKLAGGLVRLPRGFAYYVDPAGDAALRVAAGIDDGGLMAGSGGVALARLSGRQREQAAKRMRAVLSWQAFRAAMERREARRDPCGFTMTVGGADGSPARPPRPDRRPRIMDAFNGWSDANSEALGFGKPISWNSMWRWQRALASGDGIVELAPRPGGPAASEPSPEAWAFFQTLYLTGQKRSVYDCWVQTKAEAQSPRIAIRGHSSRGKHWVWPSYAIIQRKVERDIPRATAVLHRQGRKALEDTCIPYIERDYESLPANGWWSVDHHQLDVAAVNPVNGRPAFPWITHWQDVRSRKCMGIVLSFQPNTDVVLASLRRALIEYGVPANMLFDNGKDFKSNLFTGGRRREAFDADELRVRAALHHLPIAIHFAQPYNAKAKPNERTFLTTRLQFSKQWASYRGNCPQAKPEGLARVIAEYERSGLIPAAADLETAVRGWFDTVYGERVHGGAAMHGRSPNRCYEEELAAVTRVADEELILLMYRTTEPLVVGRNGVQLFGRKFHAPELFAQLGKKVYARYDPAEIGRVYVFTLADELICVAERRDLLAWGASHEDIRERMRVKGQYRKIAAAYATASETLTGDALQNIALQRRAAETAAAAAGPSPEPPGGGEPRSVIAFRSALADTVEQLKRLPKAAGAEGSGADADELVISGPAVEPTDDDDLIFDDLTI